MRILLDTHVFLWDISAAPQLPEALRDAIRDPENEVYLSAASVWEAVIKHALGKLPLPQAPAEYLPQPREAHQMALSNGIKSELDLTAFASLRLQNWRRSHGSRGSHRLGRKRETSQIADG